MVDKPYILQEEGTFPFLLLRNVAEMCADVVQSIFFSFCKFGLRIFFKEATAGMGFHCGL